MVYANEFDRLRERMEQSRTSKEEQAKDAPIGQESEDEQIFNSSIRQLWQQAVNVHKRSTENGEEEPQAVIQSEENGTMGKTELENKEESGQESSEQEMTEEPHADAPLSMGFNDEDVANNGELENEPAVHFEGAGLEASMKEVDLALSTTAAAIEDMDSTAALLTEEISIPMDSAFTSQQEHVFSLGISETEQDLGLGTDEAQSVESLAQISIDQLHSEVNQLMESIYAYHQRQLYDLFGTEIPSPEPDKLGDTGLGLSLQHILGVVVSGGKVTVEAVQAVDKLIPVLWKAVLDDSLRVPEDWYRTQLGFLFRYIKTGTSSQKFDPVDLSTAATILHMSERELIEIYPKLGGVKLASGYVFSRQRIEEYKTNSKVGSPAITVETLQDYYRNTKDCLSKLMRIHHFMSESNDEIRYVRDLLLSGIDFTHNRIKQHVKVTIEKRLSELYQRYQAINQFNFEQVEVGQNEIAGYSAPNIFAGLEQLSNSTMSGETLTNMLEAIIKLVDDERTKMNEMTIGLTKNLGHLNIEIEMLKIKEAL